MLFYRKINTLFFALISLITFPTFASQPLPINNIGTSVVNTLKQGQLSIQLGGFSESQASTQNINIQDLIGNHYSVTNSQNQNALIGLGYFLNGKDFRQFTLLYGIDAFYFFKTAVHGDIIQEHMFSNLSYSYNVTNLPVYAAAKALIKTNRDKYNVTLDLGIGPNFIRTSNYHERSLDGGVTIPDNAFSGESHTSFSAMGGIGFKINNAFGAVPLECGYRIFYLGEGQFGKQNSQLINSLKTGQRYAQAVTCGIAI